jgi:hypothetical protein
VNFRLFLGNKKEQGEIGKTPCYIRRKPQNRIEVIYSILYNIVIVNSKKAGIIPCLNACRQPLSLAQRGLSTYNIPHCIVVVKQKDRNFFLPFLVVSFLY